MLKTEIKQQAWDDRTQLIIDCSDEMLKECGYLGLNLDHLAEKVEYSKATIYKHFSSKEDLMIAVSAQHLQHRLNLFTRAAKFKGSSRDKLTAICLADGLVGRDYPHAVPLAQLVVMKSLWEKGDPERQQHYQVLGNKCIWVVHEIIQLARLNGDLNDDVPSDWQIYSGLMSLSLGAFVGNTYMDIFLRDGDVQMLELLLENFALYLDGVGWRPFTCEHDYEAIKEKIMKEVFFEYQTMVEA